MTLADDVITLYRALGGGCEAWCAVSEPPMIAEPPPPAPATLDSAADGQRQQDANLRGKNAGSGHRPASSLDQSRRAGARCSSAHRRKLVGPMMAEAREAALSIPSSLARSMAT